MIGYYLKVYGLPGFIQKRRKLLYPVPFVFVLLFIIRIELGWTLHPQLQAYYYWTPNSVPMLAMSVALFCIFRDMRFSTRWDSLICKIASCTFGVYLLHDGELRMFLWNKVFVYTPEQGSGRLLMHIGTAAVILFLCGLITEMLRKPIEKYAVLPLISYFRIHLTLPASWNSK